MTNQGAERLFMVLYGRIEFRGLVWRFPVFAVQNQHNLAPPGDYVDLPASSSIFENQSLLSLEAGSAEALFAKCLEFLPCQSSDCRFRSCSSGLRNLNCINSVAILSPL